MGSLFNALQNLSRLQDAEVLDGYRRYEALLLTTLTPDQVDTYATYIQQSGEVRIFEEMTPAEIADLPHGIPAIAATILGDNNISMENRRVVALLNQHGEHNITHDFQEPSLSA